MGKTVFLKKDGSIDIDEFSDLVDTKKVAFYSVEVAPNKSLHLTFYDKQKNIIPAKKDSMKRTPTKQKNTKY